MPPDTKELRVLILEDVTTDAELMVNALRDEVWHFSGNEWIPA